MRKKVVKKTIAPKKSKYNQQKLVALDLGCGQSKIPKEWFEQNIQVKIDEVIGVDYVDIDGVDVVHDLFKFPYPFKDNSIDAIFCSHFFEHVPGLLRGKFMDELYRILKPDCKMRFIHPYEYSPRAAQDFTHAWPPINQNSYPYFLKQWRVDNKLTHGHYDLKCDFDYNPFLLFADPAFGNKSEDAKMFEIKHYNDVISDMVVDLVKRVGR
jgi:predicted SAM-dependent methyltransferase